MGEEGVSRKMESQDLGKMERSCEMGKKKKAALIHRLDTKAVGVKM